MTAVVWILNGPNLGRLGKREPDVYGTASYDDLVAACAATAGELGLSVDVRQTDDEATYVGWLHDAADGGVDALVLNPAAWTHTSVAVRDAAAALTAPYVEVHLSNPLAREEFRHVSYTAAGALGVIAGFGLDSYRLALKALAARI
ncbi:MAG: 3-dehydroquinate dehydratase [Frankiaceae bacterium]|nr:3-dehydroquinate dehydratase [Frankiaceae bacterium]